MKAILTWHSIDSSGSVISTTPDVFAEQISWLASGKVRVVSIPDLVALPPETDAVALTFDDGFTNFASQAAPPLRARGLTATLFVVTDRVGRTNDWGGRVERGVPSLPLLGWTDLGRLAESGFEVGSHSRSHPDLTTLDRVALADELAGSAEHIAAELGRRPRAFAYPYGTIDREAVRAAGETYEWACTADLRPLRTDDRRELLPRLDMYYFRDPRRLYAWGSTSLKAALAVRRQLRRPRQYCRAALRRRRQAGAPTRDRPTA